MRLFTSAVFASLAACFVGEIADGQLPTQTHGGQTDSNQAAGWNSVPNGNTGTEIVSSRLNQLDVRPAEPEWLSKVTEDERNFINQLLDYWQNSSDGVKTYQCEFTRYDYDTKYCNWRDPKTNNLAVASYMKGEIRFAKPDKACYETNEVFDFALDEQQQTPSYQKRTDASNREKWICDGTAIFEFDYRNSRLYETAIPVEMQGKGLVNSPIPFLFGASKEDVLNRFWVHVVTPDSVQDEYWLEAVPKKIDDCRNYSKVELVISRTDFLPVMLHIYAPNYDPKTNNLTSRVFEFENRKVNGALEKFKDFFNRFVRPGTPSGWERVARKGLEQPQQFDRSNFDGSAQLPNSRQIK